MKRRMTMAKVNREVTQGLAFRYGQAEHNTWPPAHWFDKKIAEHETRPFAFFGVRNFHNVWRLAA